MIICNHAVGYLEGRGFFHFPIDYNNIVHPMPPPTPVNFDSIPVLCLFSLLQVYFSILA